MDFGSLRALVVDLNFEAHGVPATVTRPAPNNTPITMRVIWMTPVTAGGPRAMDFQRNEALRIIALKRSEVPTVPKGTLIDAPPKAGEAAQLWRVDGFDREEADQKRVIVIPEP